PYARVIVTGRSDYPKQINSVLCFPGMFRGLLHCRACRVNEAIKLAAARAIADCVGLDELQADYVVPSVFNRGVVGAVATAVAKAATEFGIARRASLESAGVSEP